MKLKLTMIAMSMSSLLLSGCHLGVEEGIPTKVQYVPDMVDAPKHKSQLGFLPPPEHSIAMNATFYPATIEAAEKSLTMPAKVSSDPEGDSKGKHLYETFCAVCHGGDAQGLNALGPNFPRPPMLTADVYKKHTDGFFFYRITFGSAVMPAYGYATDIEERWYIVRHLRNLQRDHASGPQTPGEVK